MEWLPIPVFLPGEFHGQRRLAGYSLWGRKELDKTERLSHTYARRGASQVALVVKYLRVNAGDTSNAGSIPGSENSSGREHSNSLQYSCLGNPMDRGAWQATVYGVAKSQTRLSD